MTIHVTGRWGEDAAANHARARRGARLLARNVRAPGGEVDLVLLERGVVVFVEVKARGGTRHGTGREAVHGRKQARLIRAALGWLVSQRLDPGRTRLRFDVVEVHPGPDGPQVTWLEDAFGAPEERSDGR